MGLGFPKHPFLDRNGFGFLGPNNDPLDPKKPMEKSWFWVSSPKNIGYKSSLLKMIEHEGFGFPWIAFFTQSLCIEFPFYRWVFPKIGVPQNAWSIMENPIKIDDLGVHPWKLTCPQKRDYFSREHIFQPLIFRGHVSFQRSTPIFGNTQILENQLDLWFATIASLFL